MSSTEPPSVVDVMETLATAGAVPVLLRAVRAREAAVHQIGTVPTLPPANPYSHLPPQGPPNVPRHEPHGEHQFVALVVVTSDRHAILFGLAAVDVDGNLRIVASLGEHLLKVHASLPLCTL